MYKVHALCPISCFKSVYFFLLSKGLPKAMILALTLVKCLSCINIPIKTFDIHVNTNIFNIGILLTIA